MQRDKAVADSATDYARAVASGTVLAGPWVRLAAERHLRDIEHGAKRGLRWYPEMGARAIEFVQMLKHWQGEKEGQPFVLSPHQAFIVGSLFGWYHESGRRRFRVAYVEVAKGDGKTPLAAAIGTYCLAADGEAGAEVYSAATSRDQASICFHDAWQMGQTNEDLSADLNFTSRMIEHPASASFFKSVSAEGRGLDGKRPHCVLVDELHEHPSGVVVEKMRAGTKSRNRALIFCITNSGFDIDTVCGQYHEASIRILQGAVENDAWFAYIAALDDGDDPFRDESCWIKANPNLGVTIDHAYLREQVREAESIPSKRNLVLRLNFCRWTQADEQWINLDAWNKCGGPVDLDALAGRRCFGGLDLAATSDFASYAKLFEPTDDCPQWRLHVRCYLPQDRYDERMRSGFVPLDQWRDEGWLIVTPGGIINHEHIEADIDTDRERFELYQIGFDRFNASEIVRRLIAKYGEKFMLAFGQGFGSMSAPMKEFERDYLSGRLAHANNKLLRWMALNVSPEINPAGDIKPARKSRNKNIDGVVAAIIARGVALQNVATDFYPGV